MESRATNDKNYYYVVVTLDRVNLPFWASQRIYIDFSESREGPRGVGLLKLLYGILGKPLPDGAVHLATKIDEEVQHALAAIRAALNMGNRERLLDSEIYIMNFDGSNLMRKTNHPSNDYAPKWAPDGSKIAFFSDRDGNNEIYTMDTSGAGLLRVTENPADDDSPCWSPDGDQFAFNTNRDGNWEIYLMDTSGNGQQNISNNLSDDFIPVWSPSGLNIVFESRRDGPRELYVMEASGNNQLRLTYNNSDNHFPDWSPDENK